MKKLFLLLLFMVVVVACSKVNTSNVEISESKVTIFKSPSCGCCEGYASELRNEGFDVEVVKVPDMSVIKQRFNIPGGMESCHTMQVGDYFVEGHVPIEVVNKLISETPDVDGVALPNMPAGSPGMPGVKDGVWQIYSLKNGQVSDYVEV